MTLTGFIELLDLMWIGIVANSPIHIVIGLNAENHFLMKIKVIQRTQVGVYDRRW